MDRKRSDKKGYNPFLNYHKKRKVNRSDNVFSKSSSSGTEYKLNFEHKKAKTNNTDAKQIKPESSSTTESDERNSEQAKAKPLDLSDLNVDCLLELMEYLQLSDVCVMAEVCVAWKDCVLQPFTMKYGKKSLAIPSNELNTLVKARRLLYNFGHLVRSLNIDYQRNHQKLFILIRKYCSETIENVVIRNEPICDKYLSFVNCIFLSGNFSVQILKSKSIYTNQRKKSADH